MGLETLPKEQKVALVRKLGGPVEISTVPLQGPKEGEVLVKVLYTGVCQSDLHTAEGIAAGPEGSRSPKLRFLISVATRGSEE